MRHALGAAFLLLIGVSALAAHDLFLKPFSFFVEPGADARVRVLNGTFTKSENAVARNRLRDLSVATPNGVEHPDTASWSDAGDTSVLVFRTGVAGTYVVGASTLRAASSSTGSSSTNTWQPTASRTYSRPVGVRRIGQALARAILEARQDSVASRSRGPWAHRHGPRLSG